MNKFLKLLIILVITPFILATVGFAVLPSSVIAYIKNGENVYIGSYMIYTFSIIDLIITFFGVTYLFKIKKRFPNEEYPLGVSIVAFINLLLSVILNYATYRLLKVMLNHANIEIPFVVVRLVFTFVSVLIALYGLYLRKATKMSDFAIKNKYSVVNDLVFDYVNKFSGVVFIFGAIFVLIMSWTMKEQKQLYIISLFVIVICTLSSRYISRTICLKYKKMYKEKKKK